MAENAAVVIKGATIVSMDAEMGTVVGDVLIRDGSISAVGSVDEATARDAERVDARGMILIPGLVDCHRHVWQLPLRSVTANWSLMDYVIGIRTTAADAYRPEDLYIAQLAGALDALSCGVTTVADYSHNILSPAHGAAALRGLSESGIRAWWGAGFNVPPGSADRYGSNADRAARLVDLAAAAADHPLITMGICPEEFGMARPVDVPDQYEFARSNGLRIMHHVNSTAGGHEVGNHLGPQGLLGPDVLLVHMNFSTDEEWETVAASGASVVFTPETELQMGMGMSSTEKVRSAGMAPTIGTDIVSNNNGDMFFAARLALQVERALANEARIASGEMFSGTTVAAGDALAWITVNGARACGLEATVGRIAVGMAADLVLLDGTDISMSGWTGADAAGHVVLQGHPGVVDSVMVGGTWRKRSGRLTHDLEQVRGLVTDTAQYLRQSIDDAGGFLNAQSFEAIANQLAIIEGE